MFWHLLKTCLRFLSSLAENSWLWHRSDSCTEIHENVRGRALRQRSNKRIPRFLLWCVVKGQIFRIFSAACIRMQLPTPPVRTPMTQHHISDHWKTSRKWVFCPLGFVQTLFLSHWDVFCKPFSVQNFASSMSSFVPNWKAFVRNLMVNREWILSRLRFKVAYCLLDAINSFLKNEILFRSFGASWGKYTKSWQIFIRSKFPVSCADFTFCSLPDFASGCFVSVKKTKKNLSVKESHQEMTRWS